jgi:hypothetical protein
MVPKNIELVKERVQDICMKNDIPYQELPPLPAAVSERHRVDDGYNLFHHPKFLEFLAFLGYEPTRETIGITIKCSARAQPTITEEYTVRIPVKGDDHDRETRPTKEDAGSCSGNGSTECNQPK